MGALWAISAVDESAGAQPENSAPDFPEEAIRRRSQQIWEQEGRPEGHAEEHWARARAELAEQMARMANRHLLAPDEATAESAAIETESPTIGNPATVEEVCDADAPACSCEPQEQTLADDGVQQPALPSEVPAAPQACAERETETASALAWLATVRDTAHTSPSIICGGLVLKGDLESPGDLHFEGRLEGSLRSPSLDIGAQAVIAGDVAARELTVRGTIRGRIVADTLWLHAGAHLEGEVVYGTLTVEEGARLEGIRFRRLG